MSLFDVFSKIGGVLGKVTSAIGRVAGVASVVLKIAKPLLESIAPSVPEVEKALDKIEAVVVKAGEEADDFFDRNLPVLMAVEEAAGRGEVAMRQLRELAVYCREASQVVTPDTIDAAERAEILACIKALVENVQAWEPAQIAALQALAEADIT